MTAHAVAFFRTTEAATRPCTGAGHSRPATQGAGSQLATRPLGGAQASSYSLDALLCSTLWLAGPVSAVYRPVHLASCHALAFGPRRGTLTNSRCITRSNTTIRATRAPRTRSALASKPGVRPTASSGAVLGRSLCKTNLRPPGRISRPSTQTRPLAAQPGALTHEQ